MAIMWVWVMDSVNTPQKMQAAQANSFDAFVL